MPEGWIGRCVSAGLDNRRFASCETGASALTSARKEPCRQEFSFSGTSPARIRDARINPTGLWVVAAMFAAGGFYYHAQNVAADVRPSTRLVVLWATLIPSFFIFLVGTVQILLIPRRAADGWIEVGPDGLRYEIGRHRAHYAWTDLAAVSDDVTLHGGWSVRGRSPSALLLAPTSGFPTSRFRRSNLHYFAERLRARVRRKYGVTLVPLTLFSREDAHEIAAAALAAHAVARRGAAHDRPEGGNPTR